MRIFRRFLALALIGASAATAAHEFWIWPEPFSQAAGEPVRLTLQVGENFVGDQVVIPQLGVFRRFAGESATDQFAKTQVKRSRGEVRLTLPAAGTHLLAFDSPPTLITLAADKFHAYLHEEGLDAIVRQREVAGTAKTPGRERYRRCAKTLLRIGGVTDRTFATRTRQRLEIIPLNDPLTAAANQRLEFALEFDGRPLAERLVKAWHKRDGQTLIVRAQSDRQGKLAFNLPYAGAWMISVVHMIPAEESADADWDSYWGNLTFTLGG